MIRVTLLCGRVLSMLLIKITGPAVSRTKWVTVSVRTVVAKKMPRQPCHVHLTEPPPMSPSVALSMSIFQITFRSAFWSEVPLRPELPFASLRALNRKKKIIEKSLKIPEKSNNTHFRDFFCDRYDWTPGEPYNGNDWRKYSVVPRVHSLRPCVVVCFHRSVSKGSF